MLNLFIACMLLEGCGDRVQGIMMYDPQYIGKDLGQQINKQLKVDIPEKACYIETTLFMNCPIP